jgi:hypothetical protein
VTYRSQQDESCRPGSAWALVFFVGVLMGMLGVEVLARGAQALAIATLIVAAVVLGGSVSRFEKLNR